MTTSFFTFGFDHVHEVLGQRFDHNTMVKITAPEPREVMFEVFGRDWSFEYPPEKAPGLVERWGYTVIEISGLHRVARAIQLAVPDV